VVADAREAAPSLYAPLSPRLQSRSNDVIPFCEFASSTSVVQYADEVVAPALPTTGVRLPLQRLDELANLAAGGCVDEGGGWPVAELGRRHSWEGC
jgi:hypothetical protein